MLDEDASLTQRHFESWRREEFIPHIQREEQHIERVGRVETSLASWVKALGVGAVVVTVLGGAFIALFVWVMQEKANQIHDLHLVAIQNQKAIERLTVTQTNMIQDIERIRTTENNLMLNQSDIVHLMSEIRQRR